jgi:tetratricopeptide (TPR) repeat protein
VTLLLDAARARLVAAPDDVEYGPRLAAALLAVDAKRFEAAGEFYEHALASQPDEVGSLLMGWGVGLLTNEQYADSARVLQRGIDLKALPDENPAFHFLLAGALEMSGQTDAALAVARQAVEKAPDNPRLHSRVAWVSYHARRLDEARAAYEQVVRQFEPQRSSVETSQEVRDARLALSNICVLEHNLPEAEEWLQQVLDEYPEDVSAQNDLGYLWADQGKHLDRALAMIENAIASEPDNAAYLDSLGWVLYRLGRYAEAAAPLEKAVAGAEPEGVILDHLGDVYLALNQMDKAVAVWRQALTTFDQQTEAEKIAAVSEKIARHATEGDAAAQAPSPGEGQPQ